MHRERVTLPWHADFPCAEATASPCTSDIETTGLCICGELVWEREPRRRSEKISGSVGLCPAAEVREALGTQREEA